MSESVNLSFCNTSGDELNMLHVNIIFHICSLFNAKQISNPTEYMENGIMKYRVRLLII
jgi:hypothetical protein